MSAVPYTIERCVYEVIHVTNQDALSFKDKVIQLVHSKTYDKMLSEYRDTAGKEGESL